MISKELAYWVGVAQSDGHLNLCKEKRKGKLIDRAKIQLGVADKSIPMLEKFQRASQYIFKTPGCRCKNSKNSNIYEIRIKRHLETLKKLDITFFDPPKPPEWCLKNPKLFGAYLAGIIDGDGDIKLKRPKSPQGSIRITSGKKQEELTQAIRTILKCGCSCWEETRIKNNKLNKWYVLEFYITYKNYKYIKKYLLPEIAMDYKKDKISNFIKTRIYDGGESNPALTDHNRM